MKTVLTWAFRLAILGFLGASIALAIFNHSPGSVDSCDNMSLARHIAQGRGYVTRAVGQLWVRQTIPTEDTVKPPALPMLLAAIFRAFGESLAVPILVNALAVAANALILRRAVARMSNPSLGEIAGLLSLLSYDYEMVSIWNNNFLTLGHSALLYLASRRVPGLPVALAVVTSLGFLMKPTFVLGSVPFSCLVLGQAVARSKRPRWVDVLGYLALVLAMTSPYWGRNLLVHGAPLYSPSFTSSRLALRYGVLGEAPWQTVRLDRPMTYREVVSRIGWSGLVLGDLKELARTAFYAICLNPSVVLVAGSLLLFGSLDRWRDYAGSLLLIAAIGFEVGVYNHLEFRYLWPMVPPLIALASFGVREFEGWGVAQMTPALALRVRRLFALLGVSAVLIGGLGSVMTWRQAFQAATRVDPGWISSVGQLPPNALVLTSEVALVSYWTDRSAVITPVGPRSDLETLIALYPISHVLVVGDGRSTPFRPKELALLDQGEGWTLYRFEGIKP